MATNVVWSTLFLGNISDMDTNEGSRTIEDSSEILSTFGSVADPLWKHVVDVTTDSTDDNNIYTDNSATSDTITYDLGAGPVVAQVDSVPLMAGTVTFRDGSTLNLTDLSVFQDTNGNLFLAVRDNQPALVAQGIESIQFTSVTGSDYAGLTQLTRDDLDFVCYAAGTRILTPKGECPVETLSPGDEVVTLDHGVQPIRWSRISTQPLEEIAEDRRPVLIETDALGPGIPSRDLVVSPQHRILIGGQQQLAGHFDREEFAPAKALTLFKRIRHLNDERPVDWVHFACDRHEIVRANGCWSESLLLGKVALSTMTASELRQLRLTFGPGSVSGAPLNGPPARNLLGAGALRRRMKNAGTSLVAH